ncbi:adventurous gliding motility protein AgmC [Melittangium boletus]|uniref:adventurous gliding motility protein AgmC n=1 Tax=Melittangium boletus TaxID=83453 RepID=UPI003DA3581B
MDHPLGQTREGGVSGRPRYVWARVLLLLALLSADAVMAEPDTFAVGKGTNGTLTADTSTVVNAYAHVTSPLAPGDLTVSIDGVMAGTETGRNQPDTAFKNGDLVMILQTTGAVPSIQTGLTTAVDLGTYGVGRWEFARLKEPVSSSVLALDKPLLHGYPATATQVIRVPEYTTVTVGNAKSITARDWNGRSGGVIAILASNSVTITGTGLIDASGQGFRGGRYVAGSDTALTCTGNSGSSPDHAQKGEGMDSTRYFDSGDLGRSEGAGRGNFANGAGGGICPAAGGGGGGNAAAGGRGGDATSTTGDRGGMGGVQLLYSLLNRLTFGGGGGSGHGTRTPVLTSPTSDGGSGGGIIFIRAGTLNLTGSTGTPIRAFGNPGLGGAEPLVGLGRADGGGGGGAGGTVVVRLMGMLQCSTSSSIDVKGGAGGTADTGANPTPGLGGGGAGGRVLYQMGSTHACNSPIALVTPGAPSGASSGSGSPATRGESGSISSLQGPLLELSAPTLKADSPVTEGGYTKERRPLIEGGIGDPAYAHRQVVIYQGSVEIGRTSADANGDFSFKMPQELADGLYKVSAAFAYQGVESPKSTTRTFTVDTTPPAEPVIDLVAKQKAVANMLIGLPDLGPSPDYALELSGRAEPFSTVTVKQKQTGPSSFDQSGQGVTDGLGKWTVTINQPTPVEYSYKLTATAVDRANNQSPTPTTSLEFRLDTKPPAPPEVSTVGGVAPGSRPINSLRPVLEGTADHGSRVVVTLQRTGTSSENPQTIETTSVSGHWKVVPPVALSEAAEYDVGVKAFDSARNETPAAAVKRFSVDTIAPALSLQALGQKPKPPSAGMRLGGTDLTADHQLSVSGTAESGSTVTVRQLGENAPADASVTVDTQGHWSISLAQPMDKDEAYRLEVEAKDSATNTRMEVLNFTLDTRAPQNAKVKKVGGKDLMGAAGSCTAPRVTTSLPLFEGEAEARGKISISLSPNAGAVEPTYASGTSGTGNWSTGPSESLPTPSPVPSTQMYTVSVTVTDEVGNESPPATYCFVLDVSPPNPVALESLTLGKRSKQPFQPDQRLLGLLDVDGDKLTIQGAAEIASKVYLTLIPTNPGNGDLKEDRLLAGSTGHWAHTWTGLLTGVYGVQIIVEDEAGLQSTQRTFFFELDVTRPTLTIHGTPGNVQTESSMAVALVFDASEPIQKFECKLNGVKVGDSGKLKCTASSLLGEVVGGGSYKLTLEFEDKAGNPVAAPVTWEWVVDTNKPTSTIEEVEPDPRDTDNSTSATDIEFLLKANKVNLEIQCRLQRGDISGEWEVCCPAQSDVKTSCTKKYSVEPNKSYVFQTQARPNEPGANPGPTAELSWYVDQVKPITIITQRPESWVRKGSGGNSDGAVTVKFAAPYEPKMSQFSYRLKRPDGKETSTVWPRGTQSETFSFKGEAEGEYQLSIWATDSAGNIGPYTDAPTDDPNASEPCCTWTVDREAPLAPQIKLPEDGGHYKVLTLEGTAPGEGGSTLSVFLDDGRQSVGTTTVQPTDNGDWQLTIDATKVSEGPHTVALRLTDRAQNAYETPVSDRLSIVIDNVRPTVEIDQGPAENSASASATFRFHADETVSFQCRLDSKVLPTCQSGEVISDLSEGLHTFIVSATDKAGNQGDSSPHTWNIYLGSDRRAEGGGLGCSLASSPPALPWVLALLGLALRGASRRRTR